MRLLVLVLLALLLGAPATVRSESAPGGLPPGAEAEGEGVEAEGLEAEDAEAEGAEIEEAGAEEAGTEEAGESPLVPLSSLSIRRGENPIYVHQYAPSEAGGRTILRNAACEEGQRVSTVYSPEPYLVETLVGAMRITSRLVFERQPPEGQERAQLEMLDAGVDFDERRCPQNVTPTGAAGVTLVEGRSTVRGAHLVYDNATGVGTLVGAEQVPVTLEREPEEGGEGLNARADSMEFNLDDDRTLLRGNVTVESGGRVSEADEFEYDEAANFAFLRGTPETPATSREGADVVSGELIAYDLTTNDVVVTGRVRGTLRLDRP